MGRYDGEDYEYQRPCSWGSHKWAMNGNCFICRHSRDRLIAQAQYIVDHPSEGGRYAG